MDDLHRSRLRRVILWTAVITVAHLILGTRTHLLHGGHVLLGSLYMFPILAGAVAFGLRGGVLTSLAVCALYVLHLLVTWAGTPMANLDQLALLFAYLFVGVSAGALVQQAGRRKWERDEVVIRAASSETATGLLALWTALAERDGRAAARAKRVSQLCRTLGQRLGLRALAQEDVALAGLVHAIGLIAAKDATLLEGTSFEDLEPAERARLLARGSVLIRAVPGASEVARIVEAEARGTEGSGPPSGLHGEDVLLGASVLRVAVELVTLTEGAHGRPRLSEAEALASMATRAGRRFDSRCLDELRRLVEEGLPQDPQRQATASV